MIPSLKKLNPGLPETVYRDAYNIIKDRTIDTKIDKINKQKYLILKKGVEVNFIDDEGKNTTKKLKVFDFENPTNNFFLAIRQFEVQGELYLRSQISLDLLMASL